MAKYIKNLTENDIVLEGYTIQPTIYQLIDPLDYIRIGESSAVYTALANGNISVAGINDGTEDITDLNEGINFLKSLIPKESKIINMIPFEYDCGYLLAFRGFRGTATALHTTNLDFKIDGDRYFNGLEVILKNHTIDDKASLQIVDVDGVYFDAGTVIHTFVTDWGFAEDIQRHTFQIVSYADKILDGLYVRVVYTSTGVLPVKVVLNLRLHMEDV